MPEGVSQPMTLRDIQSLLNAEVLSGEDLLDREVSRCFACDLVSEMLAFAGSGNLLITSLKNPHVIHTAEVMDAVGVIFVGGKNVNASLLKQVEKSSVPLLATDLLMFKSCGLLYQQGIVGGKRGGIQ